MKAAYHTYDDNKLLNLWKKNDTWAFTVFCNRHIITLAMAAFSKTGNKEIAEEIAQDALYLLYKNSNKVIDNPLLYCKRILKCRVVNELKRKKRILYTTTEIKEEPFPINIENQVEEKELLTYINHHIGLLPPQCRQVFLLRQEFNLSNQEVAEKLGISVKTVKNHLTKAYGILGPKIRNYTTLIILLAGIKIIE